MALVWRTDHDSRHSFLHLEVRLYLRDPTALLIVDLIESIEDRSLLINIRGDLIHLLVQLGQILRCDVVLGEHAFDTIVDRPVLPCN